MLKGRFLSRRFLNRALASGKVVNLADPLWLGRRLLRMDGFPAVLLYNPATSCHDIVAGLDLERLPEADHILVGSNVLRTLVNHPDQLAGTGLRLSQFVGVKRLHERNGQRRSGTYYVDRYDLLFPEDFALTAQ